MVDLAVITVGVLDPQTTVDAVGLIGKAAEGGGDIGQPRGREVDQPDRLADGGLAQADSGLARGGLEPDTFEMPNLLGLYRSGHLKLDEIITRRYTLERVNEGYHDLLAGKNIRGVVIHES